MKPEYEQLIGAIHANHPESGGEYRRADATLRALIASETVAAAEAQTEAARLSVEAAKEAAAAADKQGRRLLWATWALVFATVGLLVATLMLD